MSLFSSVNIGVKTKRYTHHLPFDNNTTMSFGVVQPLFHQLLNAEDKISMSMRQLVRLAPLPVPTFGRMRLQTNVKFVKANDVCPFYEALLSHSVVNTTHKAYTPTQLPFVTSECLTMLVLHYSLFSVYVRQDGKYKLFTTPQVASALKSDIENVISAQYPFFNPQAALGGNIVSPDGADYIFFSKEGERMYCFRFTNAAKRLRSILIGLGYSLDLNNGQDKLSVLPLLAFYKAYYDTFSPSRESNWLQTSCFRLINFIYDYGFTNFDVLFQKVSDYPEVTASLTQSALQFVDDLLNCWYVEPINYVSAHRSDVATNLTALSYNPSQLSDEANSFSPVVDQDGRALPYLAMSSPNNIALRQLMKLTRFISKDSVIGKKVSDWLRVHFGADVENSLFRDSTNIANFSVNCSVNDVFSTSDTYDASSGNGETLGAYAGKGLGFNDGNFNFTAPTFGFVIALSTIVPDSNFFQGYDPTLFAITADMLPNTELDALGYEATPLASILPSNDVYLKTPKILGNKSFGFIPRYSSFKTKKDIINGDMSRRGSINSFAPYYLDKIITQNIVSATKVADNTYTIVDRTSDLPLASEAWRYTTKFPWLGNYNRIFTSNNFSDSDLIYDVDLDSYYSEPILDDLFIVQNVFDMRLNNKLKPMSDSYDTFDDDVNGDNTTTTKQVN